MRPRATELVEFTTLVVLRELARRAAYLATEIDRLDDLLLPLITLRAPALLATPGVGPDSAAILLIAAGDNPDRLRSETAWAHLCASAPIPARPARSSAGG